MFKKSCIIVIAAILIFANTIFAQMTLIPFWEYAPQQGIDTTILMQCEQDCQIDLMFTDSNNANQLSVPMNMAAGVKYFTVGQYVGQQLSWFIADDNGIKTGSLVIRHDAPLNVHVNINGIPIQIKSISSYKFNINQPPAPPGGIR